MLVVHPDECVDVEMSTARGTEWSATVPSGYDVTRVGDYDVRVIASSATGQDERSVGSLTVGEACS